MNPNHGIGLASIIELVLPQPGSSSVLYPRWDALAAVEQFLSWDFNCGLSLQVHTITGLPSQFNGSGMLFHWERRGEEDLVAGPAAVIEGVAEFQQQLDRTCVIRCSRTGPYLTATHGDPFLIYASVNGHVGFDLGVHRIHVTELLDTMLEENRQRTYELQGEAGGAVMNVSFRCWMLEDNPSPAPEPVSVSEPEVNPIVPDEPPPDEDGETRTNSQDPTTPNVEDGEVEESISPHEPTIPPTPSDDNPTSGVHQTPSRERPSSPTKSRLKPSFCFFGCCNLFKGCFR